MRNVRSHNLDRVITKEYISAYGNFVKEELDLIKKHSTLDNYEKYKFLYSEMNHHISRNPEDFIKFSESSVKYYELEFTERVAFLRDKLAKLAIKESIPLEVVWIPQVKINEKLWDSIISIQVAKLIRQIFDKETHPDFETYRLYEPIDRTDDIFKWLRTKNGKNFLYEFQIAMGIKPEALIKKIFYLFDKDFVYVQKLCMSNKTWLHKEVIEAYKKWQSDNTLWKKIDHLKRKIAAREILDESRLEIKFRRLLESNGFADKFIHDMQVSWNVKYRPDFWFVKENLVVEYDERAHQTQQDQDKFREKIIRRYIPNITFIRVFEGKEEKGLAEIKAYMDKFNEKNEWTNKSL